MDRDLEREKQFGKLVLSRLATACRQELDDLTLEVYTEALCYQAPLEEWCGLAAKLVGTGSLRWFPKVAELVDALRQFRGAPPLEREAMDAYQRVLDAGEYTAEGGRTWTYRAVERACGRAAAEAWLEAGGQHAFATSWREDQRRERFIAAYTVAVRDDPATSLLALPAPAARAALPEPGESVLSAGEVLRRLGQLAPGPAKAAPPVTIDSESEATRARLAALKRQAEEIQREQEPANAS